MIILLFSSRRVFIHSIATDCVRVYSILWPFIPFWASKIEFFIITSEQKIHLALIVCWMSCQKSSGVISVYTRSRRIGRKNVGESKKKKKRSDNYITRLELVEDAIFLEILISIWLYTRSIDCVTTYARALLDTFLLEMIVSSKTQMFVSDVL